jgi:hypothetical protein
VAGVVHINWYATVLRKDSLAAEIVRVAPLALRYTILQMTWCESHQDWYRYWDSPEMTEFRRRNSGHYQIPITYVWHEELAVGALGPEVPLQPEPEPEPEPQAAV